MCCPSGLLPFVEPCTDCEGLETMSSSIVVASRRAKDCTSDCRIVKGPLRVNTKNAKLKRASMADNVDTRLPPTREQSAHLFIIRRELHRPVAKGISSDCKAWSWFSMFNWFRFDVKVEIQ